MERLDRRSASPEESATARWDAEDFDPDTYEEPPADIEEEQLPEDGE